MPHFDLRNNRTGDVSFKLLLFKDLAAKIRLQYSEEQFSNKEIMDYLNSLYANRYISEGRLTNNVDFTNYIMTSEQFIDYFLNSDFILSGYGALFKSHKTPNLAIDVLNFLADNRKVNKDKMEASEKGTIAYNLYKATQLAFKTAMNAYYGTLGLDVSIFFNSIVQNSVTFTGQDIITTSIVAMEDFLEDNCKFKNMDNIYEFILNVTKEKYERNIYDYIDRPATIDEVVKVIMKKCSFNVKEVKVRRALQFMDDLQLTKIYYKNRILEFFKNSKMKKVICDMIDARVINNKLPEKEIKNLYDQEFVSMISEFCFYNHILIDRYQRALKDTKRGVLYCDTDSNFLCFASHAKDILITNGYEENDENELAIAGVYIDICTETLANIYWTLTTNMGIEDEYKKRINMKNEYFMPQAMFTTAKKSYATVVTAEYGKPIKLKDGENPMKKELDIKGMAIRKSVLSDDIKDFYQDMVYYDILKSRKINARVINTKINNMSKKVMDNIKDGGVQYLIPSKINNFSSYSQDTIMRLGQVRGTIIWNELEPQNQIVPPDNIDLIKLKTSLVDSEELYWLQENHPSKYEVVKRLCFSETDGDGNLNPLFKYGFNIIAIPKTCNEIPEYLRPLIDYEDMVSYSIDGGGKIIMKSIGAHLGKHTNSKTYKSNIFVG